MDKRDLPFIAALAAIISAAAYGYYTELNAPTFTLRADEWVCSRRGTVELPYTHHECIEYRRINAVGPEGK